MKKNNTLILLFTTIMIMSISITAYAKDTTQKISAINVSVTVPDGLYYLTRNVSEGNRAVEILDASPEELYAVYQQKGIYLDIFPEDIAYEIVLCANKTTDSNTTKMTDEELTAYENNLKKEYENMEHEELLYVSQYSAASADYIVTSSYYSDDNVTTYATKYYTVKDGFAYNYILQTNGTETTDEQINVLNSIVGSAQYEKLHSSITESPVYSLVMEYIIGGGISVAALLAIAYLLNRSAKKNK